MAREFICIDADGTEYRYDAAGPQDAAEQHYAATEDGVTDVPELVAVFATGNGIVGLLP